MSLRELDRHSSAVSEQRVEKDKAEWLRTAALSAIVVNTLGALNSDPKKGGWKQISPMEFYNSWMGESDEQSDLRGIDERVEAATKRRKAKIKRQTEADMWIKPGEFDRRKKQIEQYFDVKLKNAYRLSFHDTERNSRIELTPDQEKADQGVRIDWAECLIDCQNKAGVIIWASTGSTDPAEPQDTPQDTPLDPDQAEAHSNTAPQDAE